MAVVVGAWATCLTIVDLVTDNTAERLLVVDVALALDTTHRD